MRGRFGGGGGGGVLLIGGLLNAAQPILLDSANGLNFPTTGPCLRVAQYASLTPIIEGRTGGVTNAPILQVNGTGTTIQLGDPVAWFINILSAAMVLQAGTLTIQNASAVNATWTLGATSSLLQFGSGMTGGVTIGCAAPAAAGNGIPLTIGGGPPNGANSNGNLIVNSPLDEGYLRFSWPSDANQTLTAAQSANNVMRLFAGTITAARSLTITRPAAAPGQVEIRNVTGFTITVGWLTGTGVAIATGTSALIGSDGTNAELISAGT